MTAFSMLAMNIQCIVHSDIDGVSTIDVKNPWVMEHGKICPAVYLHFGYADPARPTIGLPFPQCGGPREH